MKMNNIFFKKNDKIYLSDIYKLLKKNYTYKKILIENIKELNSAKQNDLSFFNSLKYVDLLKNTKSKFVITHKKYENIVKKYSNPILVKNVLKAVAQITMLFYPESLDDAVDFKVMKPNQKKYNNIKFGHNVLVGNNVRIGKNSIIGHNTIIESNVIPLLIGNFIMLPPPGVSSRLIVILEFVAYL